MNNLLKIGTCSWKYDSWRGIVYSKNENTNYLEEYSQHYNTVEIDQWFWSLYSNTKVLLPSESVVLQYKKSVPKDFKFTIKVPNSITLTHFYNKNKSGELVKNPHFLSNNLFNEFLDSIEPIKAQVGCLIFQFEYLNKQKMVSLNHFIEVFQVFHVNLPKNIPDIGIEIRNPNYLNNKYFEFLNSLNIYHVFLQGYYMPLMIELYKNFSSFIKELTVIRLHGEDRKRIEKVSNGNWNKIYIDRQAELKQIAALINELIAKKVNVYLNINNHYEGSAPLTISRIQRSLM